MAGQIIPGYPSRLVFALRVTVGGVSLRLRFHWNSRLSAWYLDFSDGDGTDIAVGRRLSPGFNPVHALLSTALPDGYFLTAGQDFYDVDDLGTTLTDELLLLYYDAATVDAQAAVLAAASASDITITVS